MNDNVKIVIRGVLDKIEGENITEHKARLITSALDKLCGGHWNVITYPTYENEAGYTNSNFRWHNKEWVYAEQTTSTDYNGSDIKSFMDTEFGWATNLLQSCCFFFFFFWVLNRANRLHTGFFPTNVT
jgi:hypothetical protein